ncbi:hypothetical protein Q3V23_12170 [Streptomyces sp. VNUA116]|uniref:hypothetical protein n=1 Tax=Streptomyces sp. VNUA116 TaxID=3062449 RepID=UPI002676740B|nr:hypothetical protein [Streptomyces sp. VNUA116]WKU44771.1 hypothetical protein Q3V23_12170 [Streptomyces sp. VNUA116]
MFTGTAAVGLVGCRQEGPGGLDSVIVAVNADKRATARLEHDGYPVQWLTCTGKAEDPGVTEKGSPRPVTAVGVDCDGRTTGGQKIIVYGRVTGLYDDSCVQGKFTAKVDGKTVFTASVLGDCSGSGVTNGGGSGGSGSGGDKPTDNGGDSKGDNKGDKHWQGGHHQSK